MVFPLLTEWNSPKVERLVRSAARTRLRSGPWLTIYEPGVWWGEHKRTAAQYAAVTPLPRDQFRLIVDSLETPLTLEDRQTIVQALERHAETLPHDTPIAVWHDWRIGIGGLDRLGSWLYGLDTRTQTGRAAILRRIRADYPSLPKE